LDPGGDGRSEPIYKLEIASVGASFEGEFSLGDKIRRCPASSPCAIQALSINGARAAIFLLAWNANGLLMPYNDEIVIVPVSSIGDMRRYATSRRQ
jgi:hypothetical protein